VGLRWTRNQTSEWRLGYFFDKSPQPEASVSPLLPDADRNGFSVGYGYKGGWLKPDFSFMYVRLNSRTTRSNREGFNGVYNGDVVLFGVTLNW
jgi:long-chain fatty acid transport protein